MVFAHLFRIWQIDQVNTLVGQIDAAVGHVTCDASHQVVNIAHATTDAAGNIVNAANIQLIDGTGNAVKSIDISTIQCEY